MDDLYARLEVARERRGHTPEELCVALHISRYTLANWRAGRTAPAAAQRALAETYIAAAPK